MATVQITGTRKTQDYARPPYDSPRKAHFFYAYDRKPNDQKLDELLKSDPGLPSLSTAKRWLKLRREKGIVWQTSRAGHTNAGRPRKDVSAAVEALDYHSKGPLEPKGWKLAAEQAKVSIHTLRRRVREQTRREMAPASTNGLSQQESAAGAAIARAVTRYESNHPKSKQLHEKAIHSLPGGNTRSLLHASPFPICAKSGRDYQITDEDGHV